MDPNLTQATSDLIFHMAILGIVVGGLLALIRIVEEYFMMKAIAKAIKQAEEKAKKET